MIQKLQTQRSSVPDNATSRKSIRAPKEVVKEPDLDEEKLHDIHDAVGRF